MTLLASAQQMLVLHRSWRPCRCNVVPDTEAGSIERAAAETAWKYLHEEGYEQMTSRGCSTA